VSQLLRVQCFNVTRDVTSSVPNAARGRTTTGRAGGATRHRSTRLGGGVATIREFLDADLVDTMHVAVAPIELGRGERLWNSHDELLDRFHLDSVPSPSGVTHLVFWRR
jgi:dihydrofolate reductase